MKKFFSSFIFIISIILFFISAFLLVTLPNYSILYLGSFGVGLLLLIISVLIHRNKIVEFMGSKFGKSLLDNLVGFFLLFVILGLVNYIAYKRPLYKDFGKRQLNTLTEQTQKVVDGIKEPVDLIIFSNKDQKESITNLLNLYKNRNSNIGTLWVDVGLRPDLVKEYAITYSPSVVIKKGEKKVTVTNLQELALTNALIKVQRKKNPRVCFVDNPKLLADDDLGYASFLSLMKNAAYNIQVINLFEVDAISSGCTVLGLLGVAEDFREEDYKKIDTFYRQGGALFITFSPMFRGDSIKGLRSFVRQYGIEVKNDVVIDKKSSMSGSKGTSPILSKTDDRGINTDLAMRVSFPLSSSLIGDNENYISLGSSSEDSWSEKNTLEIVAGEANFSAGDIQGPVDMAGAIVEEKRARLIIIGNSLFIANKYLKLQTNFTYGMNLFHWASGQDQLTSVEAAVFKEKPIFISSLQKKVIFYLSLIAMPLAFFVLAIITFRQRRVS